MLKKYGIETLRGIGQALVRLQALVTKKPLNYILVTAWKWMYLGMSVTGESEWCFGTISIALEAPVC